MIIYMHSVIVMSRTHWNNSELNRLGGSLKTWSLCLSVHYQLCLNPQDTWHIKAKAHTAWFSITLIFFLLSMCTIPSSFYIFLAKAIFIQLVFFAIAHMCVFQRFNHTYIDIFPMMHLSWLQGNKLTQCDGFSLGKYRGLRKVSVGWDNILLGKTSVTLVQIPLNKATDDQN